MTQRTRYLALALLRGAAATGLGLSLGFGLIASAASLADQPVFSTSNVPGNLALALSVEWPTASRTAHVDGYSSTATFLGYFDPNKCYTYVSNPSSNGVTGTDKGDLSYFAPQSAAANHTCSGAWSGNFLNWASTPTIDPFRWAMTGGRRVVDTRRTTILEKAYHAGQGLFDDRMLAANEIAGATPFAAATSLKISIAGRGFKMQVTAGAPSSGRSLQGQYFMNTDYKTVGGVAAATVSSDSANHIWNGASPAPGVNGSYFSARYTGTFNAPEAGTYSFQTISDDGVRLSINGTQVINNWTDHGTTTDTSSDVYLSGGQSFTVQLDFYQGDGGAQVQLLWKKPSSNTYSVFTSDDTISDYTVRVKVCDASLGVALLEGNCKPYGDYYKPEGLIQQYSDKMRFSAFGYLNDSSGTRDGGVLRAQQKFVGPTYPVPGLDAALNTAAEWSSTTGRMTQNPDASDAAATTTDIGVQINDSGVMNYLNKFGQLIPGGYKNYDPVNELYYATLRYFRNLGNVPQWSDMSGTGDAGTKTAWADGFPVIKNWNDPIQYSCQRNFVLGIGDIYTWNDKNVPGNTRTDSEPAMPAKVTDDATVNAMTATDKVGDLQGMGANLSAVATGAGGSSYYMAGLAYDANAKDIRSDLLGTQTVQTYWVDVLEQPFQSNNKFYLAAKFGSLNMKKVPAGFDPYTFAGAIPLDWWSTTGDRLTDYRNGAVQDRPDNYFAAGRPDTLVAGLQNAFKRISNEIDAYTTSFSLTSAQVQSTGVASYGAQYDAKDWTGIVTGSTIDFATSGGRATVNNMWSSSTTLETQLAGSGWDNARRVVTWSGSGGVPFRIGNLSTAQTNALAPIYAPSATSADYLNYLRGDRSNEKSTGAPGRPFRQRALLLGDIVGAKVTPVGPPAKTFSDAVNPGYAAFKTTWANRSTMVYVGANDGMLHAFNGALSGASRGIEQFANIPGAAFQGPNGTPQIDGLAQLGSPNYQHHYYVDATPKAFDVDFNTTYGNFTTTATAGTSDWRTIVIGGLGKGGKSFYAIDVTDPDSMNSEAAVAGKILWEFTDSTMGFSFGTPNVVKTQKYGWVVVLTSGYNNTGGAGNGYIYFVNPRTGALLEKVSTGAASDGLTQASVYVRDFTDSTADAIYAGDLNGQLWRFNVTAAQGSTDPYPAGKLLATAKDGTGIAQPITTPPLIEIQPQSRKRFVIFGTGQLLDSVDIASTKSQSFYSILDGTAIAFAPDSRSTVTRSQLTEVTDVTVGATSAISLGWFLDLGADTATGIAWRLVSNMTTYNGLVAFAPLLTTGDACSPSGQSRLYALNFATGATVLARTVKPDGTTAATPFIFSANAITDTKLGSIGGKVGAITGTNTGAVIDNSLSPQPGQGVRLLNWREVPTVD